MQRSQHSRQFHNSLKEAAAQYDYGAFDAAEARLRDALEVLGRSRSMSLSQFVREFGRQELAKQMGITVGAIDKWTSGEHRPDIKNAQLLFHLADGRLRLSDILGVKK